MSTTGRGIEIMSRSIVRSIAVAAIAATSLIVPTAASRAEEGGGGHYAPGAVASFADALPGAPGWAVGNYFMYYDAGAAATRSLPLGGLIAFDLSTRAYADSVLAFYETPLTLLGGKYTVGLGVPYVSLEVDGKVTGPRGNIIAMHDSASGLGDITLYPFMVAWVKGDLKYDVRLGIYAPTGDYEVGRLANLGKNYWTVEPMVSASWISSKRGIEVSAYAGVDFNTENPDTDYKSGSVFHVDATLAQHVPLGKLGIAGLGANVFVYEQLTGDSGAGATLGFFEGRTAGIGPVLSLITKVGGADLVAELKWLPEMDVKNRVKGDYIWFKLGVAF
jgi:hypothetical protein